MYEKLCNWINKAAEVALAVSMVGMVVAVFCQVIFRYVIQLPLFWTEEAARFLMVFAVYIGCSIGIKRRAHLGFTFLRDKCPAALQLIMKTIANIGMFALNTYIIYYGIKICMRNTIQISPALQLPMWIVYLILPLGGFIADMQVVETIVEDFKEFKAEGGTAK